MENGFYALLPLLGILALIKRVRDYWANNKTESKMEEPRPPSFQPPYKSYSFIQDPSQQKEYIWNEIIQLHRNRNWRFGVFENQNYLESTFQISGNTDAFYHYLIYDQHLHFDVSVIDSFPPEITTDLFVLAAHFNNLLTFGKVVVNVNKNYVHFSFQNELSLYSALPEKIELDLIRHYQISKDVYWAFQKFVSEREEPVIIISELMNKYKMRQENTENS